jgi:hypothetical protein
MPTNLRCAGHSGVNDSAVHVKHVTENHFVIADFCHSGVSDFAVHVVAVSVTPLCARHNGVIVSAVTKIGDYKVDFLGEY